MINHDQLQATDGECSYENPFRVESPEKLSSVETVALFVEEYTDIDMLKQRKHTFLWGSRGSGKSMMLRYLEPTCQAIRCEGSMERFLAGEEPFVGVYCPCKEGQLNKSELQLLDKYASMIIMEHMMNLVIADRLTECLHTQFPEGFLTRTECSQFAQGVSRLFDKASIAPSIEEANGAASVQDEPLQWLRSLIAAESGKVSVFLRNNAVRGGGVLYQGATSGYHDFLLPLTKVMQRIPRLVGIPVYLLLDDADRLTKDQQSIVNGWIANRDQALICLKVSAQREGYQTFLTRDGGMIEEPHDYSDKDVDELYTRSKSDYFQKVKLISERRLKLSDLPATSIESFLPADSHEDELLVKIKKETAVEWEKVGCPGRREDFVTRYAIARLFQLIRKQRGLKSYAGFQNVVHLSSGVVRSFLEPCYLMFSECVSKGADPKTIDHIPPTVQNEVLRKYSEEFLLVKFEDIRKDLPRESWTNLEALRTLLESLGRLFYGRLTDPNAREARLFSFTVRGQVPADIDEVLRLGVRYRYFQLRTYSSKEGGGREKWYILNRRLCPIFKLDPSGFEGRISLTPESLRVACSDPERFVRERLKQSNQPMLFSPEEGELK